MTIKFDLQLISLMIENNDFCSEMCWIPSAWSILERHKADLLQVFQTLRDNLPDFCGVDFAAIFKGLGRQS